MLKSNTYGPPAGCLRFGWFESLGQTREVSGPVGEPLMTRSAGNLISGEVVRNKRSAQWAVAPIENAELSAKQKRLEFVGAKRVQTPLQGVCTTIERTERYSRAGVFPAEKSNSSLISLS